MAAGFRIRAIAVIALLLSLAGFPALAGSYILFDVNNGKVLAEEDALKRWYPASLTKLMTAYVAFRAIEAGEMQMNSPVRISKAALSEPPSKMDYPPGSVLTLDTALKIIMVKSANDVATAVAEAVGGTKNAFIARMNQEAARLGMADTHFANAHGLHTVEHYSTARDLALLVQAIRLEFPQYADYFAIEGLRAGEKIMPNYNFLIGRFDGADGMKTGYVCASGFNLIATATRGQRTLGAIVLGAGSQVARADKAAELLTQGFKTPGNSAPSLTNLRSSNPDRNTPTDMRPVICSSEAIAERSKQRDDEGRLVVNSPYVQPMEHEPRLVSVKPEFTAPIYADVPIPTPRPEYPPREEVAVGAEGD